MASETMYKDVSQVTLVALSADREIIQAVCNIRLRIDIDPEDVIAGAAKVAALLKGKRALATWDIAALLRDEVFAKVLIPKLAALPVAQLRADQSLLAGLELHCREVLQRTLGGCGLRLEGFSIAWGLTEQERAEIAQRRAERQERALEFAKTRRVAHLKREQEIDKARLQNLQELKTAEARGDQELKALLLAGGLDRDLMEGEHRVNLSRVDARMRDITLEVEKKESIARLEVRRAQDELRLDIEDRETKQKHAARLASIDADDKEMWSMVKMQIELATQKNDRETSRRRQEIDAEYRKMQADIDDRFQQRKLKLDESLARMGLMERLVSQGLSTGAGDASVLKTMLQQMTEQEYSTTSDAMVKARADAQAAGSNLDTYRQALADERRQQVEMTRLSAELMQAAKQPAAPVLLVQALPGCKHCGAEIQAKWKACPACGNPLQA